MSSDDPVPLPWPTGCAWRPPGLQGRGDRRRRRRPRYLRWVGHRGAQRPRPRCPGCRRRLDEQFLQRYHDSLPLADPLRRTAPCCGTEAALNAQLRWPWETGHARLVLQAMTRQRPPKAKVIRAAMGAALGCPVRVYQEMLAGPDHLPIKG